MQHFITPTSNQETGLCWWDDAFTEKELDILQGLVLKQKDRANVGNGNIPEDELEKVRRSKVGWLPKNEEVTWVYEKLSYVVSQLNARFYQFDLTGFGEPLQLTNYNSEEQGMYRWHQDFGSSASTSRKLSLVLQLSHPSDYEGGNLQILTCGEPTTVNKKRGHIAVFPSWTLHQVTPVTKGTRQTIVTWISGPQFR